MSVLERKKAYEREGLGWSTSEDPALFEGLISWCYLCIDTTPRTWGATVCSSRLGPGIQGCSNEIRLWSWFSIWRTIHQGFYLFPISLLFLLFPFCSSRLRLLCRWWRRRRSLFVFYLFWFDLQLKQSEPLCVLLIIKAGKSISNPQARCGSQRKVDEKRWSRSGDGLGSHSGFEWFRLAVESVLQLNSMLALLFRPYCRPKVCARTQI